MTGIYLDQDQADDLCELLGHIRTVAWWLLFASDQITGDLAQAAYPAHFHPPSAVFWLTEDLIHIGDRLHQAIHPDNDNSDQPSGTNRRNPAAQAGTRQAGTSSTAPSRDELDNSTPIGNHKRPIVRRCPDRPGCDFRRQVAGNLQSYLAGCEPVSVLPPGHGAGGRRGSRCQRPCRRAGCRPGWSL